MIQIKNRPKGHSSKQGEKNMKWLGSLIIVVCVALAVALTAPAAWATPITLNFDDLPSGNGTIPNQEYPASSGIHWVNWLHSDANWGSDYAPFSGNIRLYLTTGQLIGKVTWPDEILFLGTAFSTGDPNQSFRIEGYLGGSKVFSSTTINGEYRGFVGVSCNVDEVRLVLGTPYGIIDNWQYDYPAPVPLPSGIVLLGTGVPYFFWRLRRLKGA
jgi:hypothetical protein